jgi:hypothetical protein
MSREDFRRDRQGSVTAKIVNAVIDARIFVETREAF